MPAGQTPQIEEPVKGWYFPAGQMMQLAAPMMEI
jgi:hypothetical protein